MLTNHTAKTMRKLLRSAPSTTKRLLTYNYNCVAPLFAHSRHITQRHFSETKPLFAATPVQLNNDIQTIKKEKEVPKTQQEVILEQERRLLSSLKEILISVDADPKDIELLTTVESGLEELFLMVVVGEFNSGKSSFINALLGDRFLKDGM
jgi:ribosome biogenesis GTPase A